MTAAETKRTERVRSWRESGKDVYAFGVGQPFAASSLRWWASRLKRLKKLAPASPPKSVAMARVLRRPRVEPTPGDDASLVIDVVGARIVIRAGFDARVLRDVVTALGGTR